MSKKHFVPVRIKVRCGSQLNREDHTNIQEVEFRKYDRQHGGQNKTYKIIVDENDAKDCLDDLRERPLPDLRNVKDQLSLSSLYKPPLLSWNIGMFTVISRGGRILLEHFSQKLPL